LISIRILRGRCSAATSSAGDELLDALDRAVVHRDTKAFALHVQGEVLAHHGESDESDVGEWLSHGASKPFAVMIRRAMLERSMLLRHGAAVAFVENSI
jgi:hypothetical protein